LEKLNTYSILAEFLKGRIKGVFIYQLSEIMSGFFKKALGVFVEFDESSKEAEPKQLFPQQATLKNNTLLQVKNSFNQGEIEKFEKHFEQIFNKANLPGPDYFEFWKMMETLEAHIPDEKARMSAVYASLVIQGLTKDKLIASASHYKTIIEKDKTEFEKAVADKSKIELDSRIKSVSEYEKKVADHAIQIQNLTKEIGDSQAKVTALKLEISEAEQKISSNTANYNVASDAMINKLTQDIQKIQTSI